MTDKLKNEIKATNKYVTFLLPLLLIVIDYIAIVGAELGAVSVRNFLIDDNAKIHISWLNYWVVFPAIYLFFLSIEYPYNRRVQFYKAIQKIFYAVIYGTVVIILVLYFGKLAGLTSRLFVVFFGVFTFINLVTFRYAFKKFLEKRKLLQIPILIIGAGKTAEMFVKGITNLGLGYKVVGLLEDNKVQSDLLQQYKVLGGFEDAESVIKALRIQHVFIAAPGLEQEKLASLIYRVQPLVRNVGIIPNLVGVPMGEIEAESLFNERLMLLRITNNLEKKFNVFIKTVFDYIVTFIGTIIISPILLIIAGLIYIDSPGPIIFKQMRIGKNGKNFSCYKFRSMFVNGDEILERFFIENPEKKIEWEIYHKLDNDPRVTSFGKFLRTSSMDELPQLFNVLLGHMSLVGPRPYLPSEANEMGESINTIILTKPGITGYWQVYGRSNVDFASRIKMDCWYIFNWNFWLDLILLFRTIGVVLNKKGAK